MVGSDLDNQCKAEIRQVGLKKVFVTVGTTSFDELIRYFDVEVDNVCFTFQISNGKYIPRSGVWFRISKDFDAIVDESDLIITHAGAGSVYSFLEKKAPILVVPNTERNDKHQLELARYLKENRLANVATLEELLLTSVKEVLDKAYKFDTCEYLKDQFFLLDYIIDYFDSKEEPRR